MDVRSCFPPLSQEKFKRQSRKAQTPQVPPVGSSRWDWHWATCLETYCHQVLKGRLRLGFWELGSPTAEWQGGRPVPVDLMSDDQIDQVCSRHVIGLIPAAVLQALEISLLVLLRHLADPADHLLLFVDCLVPVRLLYDALLSSVPAGPSSWRS